MMRRYGASKATLYALCTLLLHLVVCAFCPLVYATPLFLTKSPQGDEGMHKRSVLWLSLRAQVLQASTTTYFSDYAPISRVVKKLHVWKRIKNNEVTLGFGLAGDAVVAGTLHARGFLRIFENASARYAWSFSFYEPARWILRYGTTAVPLGIALTYKLPAVTVNAWTRLSDFKAQNPMYHTGLLTTFTTGRSNWYQADLLYQYSMRKSLTFSKSAARSWYLTQPTNLQLHSIAMRHGITTAFMNAKLTAKLSMPETLTLGGGGSVLLRFTVGPTVLKLFAQGASPNYVSSSMEYQRTLWSHSSEFAFSYASVSFLRLRYSISSGNPMTERAAIQGNMDRTIQQYYNVTWKQEIPSKHSAQHLLFRYEFASQHARHKASVGYSFDYKLWDITHALTTQYEHRVKKGAGIVNAPLKHIDLLPCIAITKKEVLPNLDAFMRFNATVRVYEDLVRKNMQEQQRRLVREVTLSMGILLRVNRMVLRISFPYAYKTSQNFSSSITFSMRYTID